MIFSIFSFGICSCFLFIHTCRTHVVHITLLRPTISLPTFFICNVKRFIRMKKINSERKSGSNNNLNYHAVVFAVDYCYFCFFSSGSILHQPQLLLHIAFYHRCHPNFLIGYFRPYHNAHTFLKMVCNKFSQY